MGRSRMEAVPCRRSSAPDPLAENQAVDSQEVAGLLRDAGVLN
jgi:hypothetical protein